MVSEPGRERSNAGDWELPKDFFVPEPPLPRSKEGQLPQKVDEKATKTGQKSLSEITVQPENPKALAKHQKKPLKPTESRGSAFEIDQAKAKSFESLSRAFGGTVLSIETHDRSSTDSTSSSDSSPATPVSSSRPPSPTSSSRSPSPISARSSVNVSLREQFENLQGNIESTAKKKWQVLSLIQKGKLKFSAREGGKWDKEITTAKNEIAILKEKNASIREFQITKGKSPLPEEYRGLSHDELQEQYQSNLIDIRKNLNYIAYKELRKEYVKNEGVPADYRVNLRYQVTDNPSEYFLITNPKAFEDEAMELIRNAKPSRPISEIGKDIKVAKNKTEREQFKAELNSVQQKIKDNDSFLSEMRQTGIAMCNKLLQEANLPIQEDLKTSLESLESLKETIKTKIIKGEMDKDEGLAQIKKVNQAIIHMKNLIKYISLKEQELSGNVVSKTMAGSFVLDVDKLNENQAENVRVNIERAQAESRVDREIDNASTYAEAANSIKNFIATLVRLKVEAIPLQEENLQTQFAKAYSESIKIAEAECIQKLGISPNQAEMHKELEKFFSEIEEVQGLREQIQGLEKQIKNQPGLDEKIREAKEKVKSIVLKRNEIEALKRGKDKTLFTEEKKEELELLNANLRQAQVLLDQLTKPVIQLEKAKERLTELEDKLEKLNGLKKGSFAEAAYFGKIRDIHKREQSEISGLSKENNEIIKAIRENRISKQDGIKQLTENFRRKIIFENQGIFLAIKEKYKNGTLTPDDRKGVIIKGVDGKDKFASFITDVDGKALELATAEANKILTMPKGSPPPPPKPQGIAPSPPPPRSQSIAPPPPKPKGVAPPPPLTKPQGKKTPFNGNVPAPPLPPNPVK